MGAVVQAGIIAVAVAVLFETRPKNVVGPKLSLRSGVTLYRSKSRCDCSATHLFDEHPGVAAWQQAASRERTCAPSRQQPLRRAEHHEDHDGDPEGDQHD